MISCCTCLVRCSKLLYMFTWSTHLHAAMRLFTFAGPRSGTVYSHWRPQWWLHFQRKFAYVHDYLQCISACCNALVDSGRARFGTVIEALTPTVVLHDGQCIGKMSPSRSLDPETWVLSLTPVLFRQPHNTLTLTLTLVLFQQPQSCCCLIRQLTQTMTSLCFCPWPSLSVARGSCRFFAWLQLGVR